MDIKRFQLVPILENIRLNDRVVVKVSCISLSNKDVYLGTAENFIIFYPNVFARQANAKHTIRYKYLGTKKDIVKVKTVPVLNKLLCLSDATLFVLNLSDLEAPVNGNSKIKNILSFCLNENPVGEDPFSLELCLGKKKSVQIFLMQQDNKWTMLREVSIPEPPLLTSMDGEFVCLVAEKNHYMIDWQGGSSQLLFSNIVDESKELKPICKHITRGEFLVNGASHLGLFVKTSGISERPPIDWGMNVSHVAYSYPYILCLKENTVSIFSIIDQQLKEEFYFENGVYIDNFDGQILIISTNSIQLLKKIPWEDQIESLLNNGQAQEAVDLCQSLYEGGFLSSKDLDYARIIKERAGLVELKKKHFPLALQFLTEADYNVCDLLYCCDEIFKLLKLSATWIDNKDILDALKDIFKQQPKELHNFVIRYIDHMRNSDSGHFKDNQLTLNTALLLLYLQDANINVNNIQDFLQHRPTINIELIEQYLKQHKHYHILAIFYSLEKETHEKAIELWLQLKKGELDDHLCPTGQTTNIHNLLARCGDAHLIMKYISTLLEYDQISATDILTINTKAGEDSLLEPMKIVEFLDNYRKAQIVYLEYLIFELNIETTEYHTRLASIYIDIISLQMESEESDSQLSQSSRQKLVKLLSESAHYDQAVVLARLMKHSMTYECALLYGRMGEHKRAFEIYLITFDDHHQALRHCAHYYQQYCQQGNGNLYNVLLSVYMEIYDRNGSAVMKPLLAFLNHSKSKIDLEHVLRTIPADWPLPLIGRLLDKSLNNTYNQEFKTSFGRAFAVGELNRHRQTKRSLLNKSVHIDRNSACTVCKDLIYNSKFVWMPSTERCLHDYCFYGKS